MTYFAEQGLTLLHQNLRNGRSPAVRPAFSPTHHMLINPVQADLGADARRSSGRWMSVVVRGSARRSTEEGLGGLHRGTRSRLHLVGELQQPETAARQVRGPREGCVGALRDPVAPLQGFVRCGRCGRTRARARARSRRRRGPAFDKRVSSGRRGTIRRCAAVGLRRQQGDCLSRLAGMAGACSGA